MLGLKTYAYIGALVLILAVGWWLDSNGYDRALADQAAAERRQLQQDAKKVTEIEKGDIVREKIIVKWKTKLIKSGDDCATKPVSAIHAKQLRDAYTAITGSETDSGL